MMGNHSLIRRLSRRLRSTLLLGSILATPALAQQMLPTAPPIRTAVDENGVDLTSGDVILRAPVILIGAAGQDGLSFSRIVSRSGLAREHEYYGYMGVYPLSISESATG